MLCTLLRAFGLKPTGLALGLATATAVIASAAHAVPQGDRAARFELAPDDVLLDETVSIVVTGLPPRSNVTIRLRGGGQEMPWTSSATFVSDESGRIDLTRMAPTRGSYKDIDAMGLFWSAERGNVARSNVADDDASVSSPVPWTLTAEADGRVIARGTVQRRAVASGVRVTRVREAGLVGVYYELPDGERHPAVLVVGGSGGGLPPPAGVPGGLASRGYAVLALAYFGAPGLPRSLSNIPLEYFGTALQWLAAQPSVDPKRIGVVGASRGAELALLLGVTYPIIRTVVAYMPSNVVWPGCCDRTTDVAWTLGGRPLVSRLQGFRPSFVSGRPEIQVERIQGSVLLIAGRDDGVWPSSDMADKIMSRLRRNDFKYPYVSLVYDHAGHGIARPFTSTMELNSRRHPLTGRLVQMGGTPAGTAKAREDSWRQMLAFVNEHLRDVR